VVLVLLVDIVTRTVLGLFDHLGYRYTTQLNGPGSGQFVVALRDWRTQVGSDGIGAGRTFMYLIDADGPGVLWWGVVWTTEVDPIAGTVNLSGSGIQSILERRTLRRDLVYTNTDQATIAVALVAEAQTGTNRNLYIDTSGVTATGVLRDRTYPGVERKRLGVLLGQIAQVIGGFDYSFDATWAGGGAFPLHRFALSYPAPRLTPVVTILARGNISLVDYLVDATNLMSDCDGIGNQLVTTRSSPIAGYPALDGSVTHSTVTQVATLQQHADQALASNHGPQTSATVRVILGHGEPFPALVGQAVRLIEQAVIGIDTTYITSNLDVEALGAGRQATYALVQPSTLQRTDEVEQ
jgi:hypothetical protein